MNILLFTQVFYPDVVAVAQHTSDLAAGLSGAGHHVHVLCSSRCYDDPARTLPGREKWKGIIIRRVWVWGLGKGSKLRRIVGFLSFFLSSAIALAGMPKQDVVIVAPPPPLVSVLAALFAALRGGKLIYWNMDLNPDEAIAAGWMKPDSLVARLLNLALRFSLQRSTDVVVLDRFMKDRILQKGIDEEKIHIIPPWSHDDAIRFDPIGRDSFRSEFGISSKFVVMYSGNHSPLHPLDTVLKSAYRLKTNETVAFMFVGGGSEMANVKQFARKHNLHNITCLPYQPLDQLSASLSAADLQVVILGDPFVGIVHPCKIYNILAVGSPFLYVGPQESHIADLKRFHEVKQMGHFVRHGDVDGAAGYIATLAEQWMAGSPRPALPPQLRDFSQRLLVSRFIRVAEDAAR